MFYDTTSALDECVGIFKATRHITSHVPVLLLAYGRSEYLSMKSHGMFDLIAHFQLVMLDLLLFSEPLNKTTTYKG